MAFLQGDNYSVTGSPPLGSGQVLFNCWTDKVTKFDSNSFYNWEQDNQPLYDLEERSYFNWERNGFPTSAHTVVGVNLVVSADAPDSVIGCNKNIFRTVSAAINAIPEYIDYPVFVEICSFGNLGELKIDSKRFGPRGSIEIVNRAFARGEPLAINDLSITYSYDLINSAVPLYNNYYVSSFVTDPQVTTYGFLSDYCFNGQINNTKSIILNQNVLSSVSDPRLNSNLTVFAARPQVYYRNRLTASLWNMNSFTRSGTTITITPYEANPSPLDQITTHDVVPRSFEAGLDVNNPYVNMLGYFNRFSRISINNCNAGTRLSGYIFIRNCFVDGRDSSFDIGIEVTNSSKVFLENCAATRCRKAGFLFQDSKVNIARGLVSYRNYQPSSTTFQRGSGPWDTKKYRNVFGSTQILEGQGCGLLSVNSEIELIDTAAYEDLAWGTGTLVPVPFAGLNCMFNFANNDVGILMINSTFKGGNKIKSAATKPLNIIPVTCQLNTEAGIKLINSVWDFDGNLEVFGNNHGLVAQNSTLNIDMLDVNGNWNVGMALQNSVATYNKNLQTYAGANSRTLYFDNNGQNIYMVNSELNPKLTLNMPSNYIDLVLESNEGLENPDLNTEGGSMVPSVELINSKAILVHPKITKVSADVKAGETLKGVISAKSNSEVILKGSKTFATRIIGPTGYTNQRRLAALYAGDNSKIKIEGPTVIAQFAVDALAENNSLIAIGPHTNSNNGGLDISGFNLVDKDNHTMVELHSTRACLVVDKNSVLDIRDLGNYKALWDVGEYGSLAITSGVNYDLTNTGNAFAPYVSAGFIQFYPNPNDALTYTSIGKSDVTTGSAPSFTNGQNNSRYYISSIWNDVNGETNAQGITGGGVCVRALNQSKVNVLNTHFLTGWWNPSGIIYDASGFDTAQLCNRLFIWNIADNSQIAAALVSVSGAHPVDVGYHGPKGIWTTSGLKIAGAELQLSEAPVGTPDTSSLSILDYYGACSGNPYGFSSFENFGPFRLYFSTDPACNWLYNTGTGSDAKGLAAQVYAQGYQLPRNFAAPPSVSATYVSLLRKNESTGAIQASGFYYGSSMLFGPLTQRAVLDESAANTFANAKHCSVGKSGLGKVVAINFPWDLIWAGDTASSARTAGYGFRSPNTFDLSRDD